jgi:hypothetical protein
MARFDFEDILDDIKTVLVANLNTKIGLLNTEKNDGISIPTIKDQAFFMQSLDDSAANFDPFIIYGVEDIEVIEPIHVGRTAERIFISVIIVLTDNGRLNINNILFRYSRILKEIFETNFQNKNISNRIKVNRLSPVPFKALDGSETFKAIGVMLETVLA